jgi:hypothetical protein
VVEKSNGGVGGAAREVVCGPYLWSAGQSGKRSGK